jgi:hypothetical protein
VRFDVDQLCAVAAAAGGSHSSTEAIEKMKGGFRFELYQTSAHWFWYIVRSINGRMGACGIDLRCNVRVDMQILEMVLGITRRVDANIEH